VATFRKQERAYQSQVFTLLGDLSRDVP